MDGWMDRWIEKGRVAREMLCSCHGGKMPGHCQ